MAAPTEPHSQPLPFDPPSILLPPNFSFKYLATLSRPPQRRAVRESGWRFIRLVTAGTLTPCTPQDTRWANNSQSSHPVKDSSKPPIALISEVANKALTWCLLSRLSKSNQASAENSGDLRSTGGCPGSTTSISP